MTLNLFFYALQMTFSCRSFVVLTQLMMNVAFSTSGPWYLDFRHCCEMAKGSSSALITSLHYLILLVELDSRAWLSAIRVIHTRAIWTMLQLQGCYLSVMWRGPDVFPSFFPLFSVALSCHTFPPWSFLIHFAFISKSKRRIRHLCSFLPLLPLPL